MFVRPKSRTRTLERRRRWSEGSTLHNTSVETGLSYMPLYAIVSCLLYNIFLRINFNNNSFYFTIVFIFCTFYLIIHVCTLCMLVFVYHIIISSYSASSLMLLLLLLVLFWIARLWGGMDRRRELLLYDVRSSPPEVAEKEDSVVDAEWCDNEIMASKSCNSSCKLSSKPVVVFKAYCDGNCNDDRVCLVQ